MQNKIIRNYEAIGWIRILLALLVVVAHIKPFSQALPGALHIGEIAVLVFFVISGYVISKIIVNVYSSDLKAFAFNRILRIYPLFWFCFSATLITLEFTGLDGLGGQYTENIGLPNEGQLSYLAGYSLLPSFIVSTSLAPLTPAWSLVIELEFYICAAAWWYIGTKFCFNEEAGKGLFYRKTVWWGILGFVMVAAGFSLIIFIENGSVRFFGALKFGPFFLLGIFIFAIKQKNKDPVISLLNYTGGFISVSTCLFWVLFSVNNNYHGLATLKPRFLDSLMFLFLVLITFACIGIPVSRAIRKIDLIIGELTYPIYLSHLLTLGIISQFVVYDHPGWWILCILVVIAVSYGLNFIIEKPIGRLRSKVRGINYN